MSEWIKCSDRNPEPEPDKAEWVLVYADSAINCMAWFRGEWHNWGECCNVMIEDITHWMPLPPPPQSGA